MSMRERTIAALMALLLITSFSDACGGLFSRLRSRMQSRGGSCGSQSSQQAQAAFGTGGCANGQCSPQAASTGFVEAQGVSYQTVCENGVCRLVEVQQSPVATIAQAPPVGYLFNSRTFIHR